MTDRQRMIIDLLKLLKKELKDEFKDAIETDHLYSPQKSSLIVNSIYNPHSLNESEYYKSNLIYSLQMSDSVCTEINNWLSNHALEDKIHSDNSECHHNIRSYNIYFDKKTKRTVFTVRCSCGKIFQLYKDSDVYDYVDDSSM